MAFDTLENADPLAADLLVVLGGPVGAYEDHLYPWLAVEAAWSDDEPHSPCRPRSARRGLRAAYRLFSRPGGFVHLVSTQATDSIAKPAAFHSG